MSLSPVELGMDSVMCAITATVAFYAGCVYFRHRTARLRRLFATQVMVLAVSLSLFAYLLCLP